MEIVYLVMTYARYGDLSKNGGWAAKSFKWVATLPYDSFYGLAEMHRRGIMHRVS